MTVLKTIAATALTGLAALGFASASFATSTPIVEGSAEAHMELVKAIRRNGVTIAVNPKECGDEEGIMGFYSGQRKFLAVCQDNGVAGGPIVEWTANDMDTLRHEAQHMIQDCVVGTNHDHQLSPVYNSPTRLAAIVLGPEKVEKIKVKYRAGGASDLVLLLEYEAFSVAAKNIPLDQVGDIARACGV